MHVVKHHSVDQLRTIIRAETHGNVVRRMQAVLGAMDGQTAEEIASQVQLSDRAVHTWVTRYNTSGLDGLNDLPGRGRKSPLDAALVPRFQERVRAGATPADGVCTLRGEDFRRILADEFGVVRSLQSVYNLLHKLGFSVLQPRPRHPKADPVAQAAFEKKLPKRSPKSRRPIPTRNSKSGSKMNAASAKKAR
jgi:transposase